jgi:hypothetical protein
MSWRAAVPVIFVAALCGPALAQDKYPGDALPETPAGIRPPPAPVAVPRPQAVTAPPIARQGGRDAAAERLSQQLPLDPATRDLRDRLPADITGTERRLGLRPPGGPVTDLRGRVPSAAEIERALSGQR